MNIIYTANQPGERRSIERVKNEPIFNTSVIESLAYSALCYRRDTEGQHAMRFAGHPVVFEYNEPTAL